MSTAECVICDSCPQLCRKEYNRGKIRNKGKNNGNQRRRKGFGHCSRDWCHWLYCWARHQTIAGTGVRMLDWEVYCRDSPTIPAPSKIFCWCRYTVRATVRKLKEKQESKALGYLEKLPGAPSRLTFVEADLNSDDGWSAAALGCTYCLHTVFILESTGQYTCGSLWFKTGHACRLLHFP